MISDSLQAVLFAIQLESAFVSVVFAVLANPCFRGAGERYDTDWVIYLNFWIIQILT